MLLQHVQNFYRNSCDAFVAEHEYTYKANSEPVQCRIEELWRHLYYGELEQDGDMKLFNKLIINMAVVRKYFLMKVFETPFKVSEYP